VRIYADVLRKNRMCLCGMLAAEHATLPKEMRDRLKAFFDANEAWLTTLLTEGRAQKQLEFAGAASEEARLLIGALEGAMLVARSYGDVQRFASAAGLLLSRIETPSASGRRPRSGGRRQPVDRS
jgi:TetR/AcrR family transcriptional repressor of nem operon